MTEIIFTALAGNAALLLSLGLIYDIVFGRKRVPLRILRKLASGVVIGGIAIVLMLIPVRWESGIIFDTRTILLGLTGLFFGTIPTLLAMAIAGGYRLSLGGGGTLMGVATIISSALIGLVWRHYRFQESKELSLSEMYLFGGAVHAVMILCMFLLPREVIERTISTLALPVIVIYPLFTALLGTLFTGSQRRHRIDEELAHGKALLEAIFNGIPDAIVYADIDRNIVAINRSFTAILGYTAEDLKGKRTESFYESQEEYEKQGKLRFNLTATEHRLPYEAVYRKRDGTVFSGETLGTVIKSASGAVLGYIGVIRDITERKQSEQALRDSEEQFRGLVEQSIAGIYIIQDGKFTYVNPRFAEIRGFACAREIVGRDALSLVVDDDRDTVMENNNRLLAGEVQSIPYRFRALRQDGSVIGVGAHATRATYKGRPAVIGLIQDISEKMRAEEKIQRLTQLYAALSECNQAIVRCTNGEELFRQICRIAVQFGGMKMAWIGLIDKDSQDVRPVANFGDRADEYLQGIEISVDGGNYLGRGAAGTAVRENRPVWIQDFKNHPRTAPWHERRAQFGWGASATLPLHCNGVAVGVLTLYAEETGAFDEAARNLLVEMAEDIDFALDNFDRDAARVRAEDQLRRNLKQINAALMSAVGVARTLSEMRDPYTAGHERRVGELAAAIGAELGVDGERMEGLRVAGYLHDIGKITIPAEILSKPGKLSSIEFQLIKSHPQASHEVLKDVEFPWPVAQVALQHHERFDGSGYPQGLIGEAILLEARILAVADVVEAMSSHRPYRVGLGIEVALAEIERGRGSAYDPRIADTCLRLFRVKGYAIPE